MNDWQNLKLSSVLEIIGGGTPKTIVPEYWNGSIPWLSVVDFNNDYRKVYTTEKTITELGLKKSSTKLLLENDIIISARGTVGAIAQLALPMAFNQSCYGIRGKENVDNTFLYYLIKTKIEALQKNSHGSVFSTITRDTFESIDISLPPLDEQRRIAKILSSLDDKIENNNAINKNLEEQAQAIFKSWFVNFEPFGGTMPSDWREVTLGELLQVKHGFAFKSTFFSEIPTGDILTTPGNFNIGGGIKLDKLKYYDGEVPSDFILSPFDLIITMTDLSKEGDTLGFPAFIPFDKERRFLHNQRIGKIVLKNDVEIFNFLYVFFCSNRYRKTILGSATGSTVKHTAPIRIESVTLGYNEKIVTRFDELVSPIFRSIMNNITENQKLSQLRDTLLPKLMSGEVRV